MENLRLKIGVLSPNRKQDRFRGVWEFPISLDEVINWINTNLEYDVAVKEELIKRAKKYPHTALRQFLKNAKNFAVKIEKDLKK